MRILFDPARPRDAEAIADAIVGALPPLWSKPYDFETALTARYALGRLFEGMKAQALRWKQAPNDGVIELAVVDACEVQGRGDRRYEEIALVEAIKRGETLVPPVLSKSGRVIHILDGHHRTRAYCRAKQPMPAFILSVRPKQFALPKITFVSTWEVWSP